jgi:hypothetical protein
VADKTILLRMEDDMISFLADELLREFPAGSSPGLGGAALVFGGRRPALFLKKELARRLGGSFYPPSFFSMDEFISHIVSKNEQFTRMPELEAAHLVYSLAKGISPSILGGAQSFSRFYPWAGEILDMIEQLDLEGIKEPVLEDLKLKAEIGYDVPEHVNRLLKSVNSIRKEYHAYQSDNRRYSRGMLYLRAAECAARAPVPGFERIYFCGLFYLHSCEENIIGSLYSRGQAVPVFQGDPREWPVLSKTMSLFGHSRSEGRADPVRAPEISLYAGFDLHSQVGVVRGLLAGKKDGGFSGTAVVLPEPEGLVPLLSEVSSLMDDFNVSMGYPLKRSPVYSLFRAVCEAQESRDASGRYYASDYLRVILHPLVKNLRFSYAPSVTRILMHKTEEVLRGRLDSDLGGRLFVSLDEIEKTALIYDLAAESEEAADRDGLAQILSAVHGLFFRKWEKVESIKAFSLLLEEAAGALVQRGMFETYPLNSAAIERLLRIAGEFASAPFAGEDFSRQDLFTLFLERLEKASVAFSGSPLKGLQILGLLETRCLKFREIIVMEANERYLPRLRLYEPLIPREILISLGINRLEKEEEIQRYLFRRLIAGAEKVNLVYRECPENERSRFIEELVWERQKLAGYRQQPAVSRAGFNVGFNPRGVVIEKNKRVLEHLHGMTYSASSVNAYLSCPLKFYYRYVLGLKEKEDSLQDPDGADIGTFLHSLLEQTFGGFLGRKPLIDGRFRDFFLGIFEKKFDSELGKRMKSDAFMVKEIMRHRLEKFLLAEGARPVASLLALEKDFRGSIPLAGVDVSFKARVDRIDGLEDGSLMVLDYKTGGAEVPGGKFRFSGAFPGREEIKKEIGSFQLPVYVYFASRDYPEFRLVNAALYSLRDADRSAALMKLFGDDLRAQAREEAMKDYLSALGALFTRGILDPEVPFSPDKSDPQACSYCPFGAMCV